MAIAGTVLGAVAVVTAIAITALVGVTIDAIDEALDEPLGNAVSNSEVRALKNGTTRSQVIDQLGETDSTDESNIKGLARSSCIYYNVEGGDALSQWQHCFDGRNRIDTVAASSANTPPAPKGL
jgi:hypothetical protein